MDLYSQPPNIHVTPLRQRIAEVPSRSVHVMHTRLQQETTGCRPKRSPTPSQRLPACRSRLPRRIAICNRHLTFPTWIPEHLIISVSCAEDCAVPTAPAWPPTKHALHVSIGGKTGQPAGDPTCMFWFQVVPGNLTLYWSQSPMNRKY